MAGGAMGTRPRAAMVLELAVFSGCDREDIEHDAPAADEDFPQRMAEAYCAALFACDPVATCLEEPAPYASEAECLDTERRLLEEARTAAREAALTFDAECVEQTI